MKRLLALALLLPAPAMAQQPSPAQVGITSAVPNVVQVYDSSHNWATIGTVDPVTHLFTAANLLPPYVLPIASTTTLGGVKVDGTTITATGAGVISGTPAGITANSTATNGFTGGARIMYSDGSKVQSFDGVFTNWSDDARYPLYVGGTGNYPSIFQITGNNAGIGYYGFGVMVYPGDTTAGVDISQGSNINGYYGFEFSTNGVGALTQTSFMSDGPGIAEFRDHQSETSPNSLRVYNIRTDVNNGEWGALDWQTTPNILTIGTTANGTGTQRPVNIVGNPVTVNGVAVPNGIITAGTTPTSGFTAGRLIASDGTKVRTIDPTTSAIQLGDAAHPILMSTNSSASAGYGTLWFSTADYPGAFGAGIQVYTPYGSGFSASQGYGFYGFNTHDNWIAGPPDIAYTQFFAFNGDKTAGFRGISNPTGATNTRFYNTYTDNSNGEWGALDWVTTPNALTIGTQANGTGTARGLKFVQGATTIMDYGVTYPNSIAFGASTAYVFPNSNATLLGSNANPWGGVYSSGYAVGSPSSTIAGVSCAAGTVSLATLVVTKGIITHC